jgi:hypothetical protein
VNLIKVLSGFIIQYTLYINGATERFVRVQYLDLNEYPVLAMNPDPRLQALVDRYRALCRQPVTAVQFPQIIIAPVGENDLESAKAHLLSRRSHDSQYKQPGGVRRTFRSSTAQARFSPEEIQRALINVPHDPSLSAGIVGALISMGADVNYQHPTDQKKTLFKKKSVPNTRSTILRHASVSCSDEVLCVLLESADGISQEECLQVCIQQNRLKIVARLLFAGVDYSSCGTQFQQAVQNNNYELTSLIANSVRQLPQGWATEGLLKAISIESSDLAWLLVSKDADINQSSSMWRQSVSYMKPDLVAALLSSRQLPQPGLIDAAVGTAYSTSTTPTANSIEILDMLLCAGAHGPATSAALIDATRKNHLDVVQLISTKATLSVNFQDGEALRHAVAKLDMELVYALLEGSLRPDISSKAVAYIPIDAPRDMAMELLTLFLERGAGGEPVNAALTRATTNQDLEMTNLLLQKGASVNHNNGEALKSSLLHFNTPIIEAIALRRPLPQVLDDCFPLIRNFSGQQHRHIAQVLLSAGAHGIGVDKSIIETLASDIEVRDYELLQILVSGGAKVIESAVNKATSEGDLQALKILLSNSPTGEVVNSSLPIAMSWVKVRSAFSSEALKLLLSAGARGEKASEALMMTIGRSEIEESNVELLLRLGEAQVNYKDGKALQLGVANGSLSVLEKLLELGNPAKAALTEALNLAIRLEVDDEVRYKIVALIVHAQPLTAALSEALIAELCRKGASSQRQMEILELLLSKGASVDYKAGHPLQLAAKTHSPEILSLLLKFGPAADSLGESLNVVSHIENSTVRFKLAELLLSSKLPSKSLDLALSHSISDHNLDIAFAEMLLKNGASVDYDQAFVVRKSVENLDLSFLELLLQYQSSPNTLEIAFSTSNVCENELSRLSVQRPILEAGYRGDTLYQALKTAVSKGDAGYSAAELYLKYTESPHQFVDRSVAIATDVGSLNVLDLLLSQQITPSTLTVCFRGAWKMPANSRKPYLERFLQKGISEVVISDHLILAVEEKPRDHELISLFLKHNASVHASEGKSLLIAANDGDFPTFELLAQGVKRRDLYSAVFREFKENRDVWRTERSLPIVKFLLDEGASGSVIDEALYEAVIHRDDDQQANQLINILLNADADVNYKNGEILKVAGTSGDIDLIRKLKSFNASEGALSRAFLSIFQPERDVRDIVALSDAFMGAPGLTPDINATEDNEPHLLFHYLQQSHPKKAVLEHLLSIGCDPDPVVHISIDSEQYRNQTEEVNVILWAMLPSNGHITLDLLSVLLEAGGEFQAANQFVSYMLTL